MRNLLLLPCLVLTLLWKPCVADEIQEQPATYAPFWIKKDAQFSTEGLEQTLATLESQVTSPEQIVVMIHGFKKPWSGSTRDFNVLAARLKKEFEKDGTTAGIVGVQWDSSTGLEGSTKKIDQIRMVRAYREAVPLARSVGRGPVRALLLTLQEKYPKAHISVFAHSMGCEVSAAAILPEISYTEYPPFQEPYRPSQPVQLDMLVLAGSDLDYDFWYKSGVSPNALEERTKLIWITVADYLTKGDKVLNTRRRVRGRAAGSSFPRMTLEQLDQTVAERRLFLDHQNVPRHHEFLKYYLPDRLGRILDTLNYLTLPRAAQPKEMQELDEVLAAPNDLALLRTFLDRPGYATKFYALWRMERVNCGDARHMTDLSLEKIAELIKHDPAKILDARDEHPCESVRQGHFPSEKNLREAGVID